MKVTDEHISYIIKDLNYRGIIAAEVQDELIDHVCSAVELKMGEGKKFIDAYREVLESFGYSAGLRETQQHTIQSENKYTNIMLRNYITIAFRNLKKHRFYTAINILGLAIGIASCLIIVLYISQELSYDLHHEAADRIYRVDCQIGS